ncbi:WxL domain-containing protein [Yinghuangia soli]|uniref:WxL domain-containing protein n=1 Tax=Yinghuangia soli TaxID=2908204 RepID=A0AA41Q2X0_9ACTN|nr:WxL domain-containing protein [Yinghuangia soli]MCF2530553.1 WxL domain-containing protein [Yinghuangia soli]
MPRTYLRRAVAAASAGLVAVSGLVALAPAAGAGTVRPTVTCVLPAGQGTFTGPQDVTVTLDKSAVPAGGQLTGTVTLGVSPAKSSLSLTIYATPSITLAMKGAATGEVTVTGTEQTIIAVKDEPVPIAAYSGKFNIPVSATAGGRIEFTVVKMVTDTTLAPGGMVFPTTCTVDAGGDAVVADVAVEGSGGEPAVLTAPGGDLHPGQPIALGGSKFTPNGAVQVQLCNGDGSGCAASRFTADTLAVDGAGVLTGTATLAPTGLPEGAYIVKVVGGEKEAQAGISVKPFVVTGPREATLSTSSGGLGTVVHITGRNWTPNVGANVTQLDSDGFELWPTHNFDVGYDGTFTTQFTIDSPWVKGLLVREGTYDDRSVTLPFTLTEGPPPATQNAAVTLAPGTLTMSQAGTGLDFGAVTLNGEAQTAKADLNRVTVLDTRGGNLGWSLTGTMTDLTAANGVDKIPAGNIAWTPSCAASAASLNPVADGSPGPLGATAATLCSAAPTGATTGGKFTADAELVLTTPKFAAAGAYTGTLTLTLA